MLYLYYNYNSISFDVDVPPSGVYGRKDFPEGVGEDV